MLEDLCRSGACWRIVVELVYVSFFQTVHLLCVQVEKRYLLPRQVQRWIFGRHLAKDKEVIRELLQADLRRAEVFMYVVKAKKGNLDESIYQEFIRSMLEKKEEQKDHQAVSRPR